MTLKEYRAKAREALTGKYWGALAVCLLVSLIVGIVSGIGTLFETIAKNNGLNGVTGTVIAIVGAVFVTNPLIVGLNRYFIKSIKEKREVNDLAYPFQNGFSRTVTTMLLETVYVMLWSLLFIIPGIVKSYSYYMVDYILAENPQLETERIFEISKKAMDGYKMRAFLLQLSFIGYYILSIITFGIGFVFLAPYLSMAMTVFYDDVKKSAIERGIIQPGELPEE